MIVVVILCTHLNLQWSYMKVDCLHADRHIITVVRPTYNLVVPGVRAGNVSNPVLYTKWGMYDILSHLVPWPSQLTGIVSRSLPDGQHSWTPSYTEVSPSVHCGPAWLTAVIVRVSAVNHWHVSPVSTQHGIRAESHTTWTIDTVPHHEMKSRRVKSSIIK